jgi:hypothetical protein
MDLNWSGGLPWIAAAVAILIAYVIVRSRKTGK